MDLKLAGKTALVTGGSKGIGRAAAEILAGEGCNVIIVSRSSDALAAAKSAIAQKSNVRVDTVAADLSDSATVNELARHYPNIDILVNNAGAIPGGSLLNVDEATWRKAWDLKVFGYVNMCRAFYALMQKRKRGVIVNVVGNAADTHDPEYICGVAGNAALAAFTQSLGSVSGRDRPTRLTHEEEGTRSHRQRRQLEGLAQTTAIRPWRHRGRNRRRHRIHRFRSLRLHQWIRCYDRRRIVRACPGLLNGDSMPHLTTDDGVKLYYDDTGKGIPIVFVHEFAGDVRSWEQQVRHFSKYYRCITFNARGYPPSDVPKDQEKYSQERARDDIRSVLDALKIEKAHIVGLSMGGFAALHFGFTYGDRARSIVVAGCGYGAAPGERAKFAEEAEASAKRFEELTMKKAAEGYALGPTRVQHQNKDPRGWREFADQLAEHSTEGAAFTMRGVQKRRPSLFDLVDKMKTITVPTLIMTGDEDWPCLEPGILMKKNIPTASLVVMGNCGHNINLEEPALFNMHLSELFQAADAGAWPKRDPRAMAGTILGR
jgi:pimeloyl-ACP methyl ester carboxylesterase/NAD(P)-dependent dehydrogenase (short-subunit alcohol dehydrogenase family)